MKNLYKHKNFQIIFIALWVLIIPNLYSQEAPYQKYVYKSISADTLFTSKDVNDLISFYSEGVVDASAYLTEKQSSQTHTQILQDLINRYKRVLLPNYEITIGKEGLDLVSNAVLVFCQQSALILEKNTMEDAVLLRVYGVRNVKIINPVLRGDKEEHKGDKGEFGHGISINSSENVLIQNFDIRNFWGDGIYVGMKRGSAESKNIKILNGIVDNNRRNGISITNVDGIEVKNVIASNSNGTKPMYGIDIEPNSHKNHKINNIRFENITTYNNAVGGMMISINKMAKGDHKNVNISIKNYKDYSSFFGLYLGRVTNDFQELSGSINISNIILTDNQQPFVAKSIDNDNFKIRVSNFRIDNPRNKNAHTDEGIRVLRLIKNIIIE